MQLNTTGSQLTNPGVDQNDGQFFSAMEWFMFLAALAALYLTLVSQSVSDSLTATLEFRHND